MTHRAVRLVMLSGVVPLAAVVLLCLYRPSFFSHLEYRVYDTLLRAAATDPPGEQIVIVDVDEQSLSAIGQWPWRRDVMGELIDELRSRGAAVIALDIIFAEPDRYEGRGPTPDAVLADTLRGGRVVLGYAMTFEGASTQTNTCVEHPVGLAVVHREDEEGEAPFFKATSAVCNLHVLTQAAGGSGFLNAAPDPDGLLRRVPLLAELGGRVYPSLALAAVSAATHPSDVALHVHNVNTSSLRLGDASVPLDGKSNLLLRYRGPKRTFRYVSAVDVLTGDAPPGAFEGKIAFVGTTALGTREVVSTPLDTLFTGVEVQATVADNLLQRDFISRSQHGVALEAAAVFGLGLIPVLIVGWFGVTAGVAGTAACLAISWAGAAWLIATNGTFVSPLFPSLGLMSAIAVMTTAGLTAERRRADRADEANATSRRLLIETLLSLTDIRDAETGRHSRRIQHYTRVLATQLARNPAFRAYLTPERIDLLATLGPVHDIGKIGVPDHLLKKPGPLTPDELRQIRTHPAQGRDAIINAQREAGVQDDLALQVAKDIVYTHHERWNGTGYPQGLRGTEIPVAGRVIGLVDVYDALRSARPYHQARSHEQAVAEIVSCRGTHFDPAVVDAFVEVAEAFRRLSESASDQGRTGIRPWSDQGQNGVGPGSEYEYGATRVSGTSRSQ